MFNEKTVVPVLTSDCVPDLANVDTGLSGLDKERLTSMLQNYSGSFINVIPQSRGTTGQLENRLIDPNKTVQRLPYRLSVEENVGCDHYKTKFLPLCKPDASC